MHVPQSIGSMQLLHPQCCMPEPTWQEMTAVASSPEKVDSVVSASVQKCVPSFQRPVELTCGGWQFSRVMPDLP